MGIVINWILQTTVGRVVGGFVIAALTFGVLFAGCQVRGCMRDHEEVKAYRQVDKIGKEIQENDTRIDKEKERVDGLATDDDFRAEFDRLRNYNGE